MKTYFRLLSFAKPIEKFAIPYILCTLLAVIFNTLNFTLLVPLLNTLFHTGKTGVIHHKPDKWYDIIDFFNYYAQEFNRSMGIYGALKFICVAIVISVLLSNVFKYISKRIIENLRIHTLANFRKAVFNNVMDMHLGFFSNERKGEIISKIASDVQVVQYSVTGTLQVVFSEPLQLIAYLIMLFAISVKLTLFSMCVIPISAFFIGRLVKNLKQKAKSSQASYATMISYLDEALTGVKIIKAFNATFAIKEKFNNENKRYSGIAKSVARKQQLAGPISEFLGVLMVAIILLYGGRLVINGDKELTAAAFITYIAIFSQVMRPAKALTDSFSNIHSGIAAGERVLELIDRKPAIIDTPDAISVNGFNHSITLTDITFSYADKVILDKLSLTIPRGKTIALVGPSGGGKSTLMDLILRFIEPENGSVKFDETDIRDIKTDSLRSQIGFVNQESVLFNDTIFNNIAFGKPGATDQEVETAAKIANAHSFILETENGYHTNIGDRGMKLSGGQKQRINIARAVLKNPPIMLLDEATSALDTESEKLVQDALNNLMRNRTSLVIAHRLSTIRNADTIVILNEGRIVEKGTHAELIDLGGLYNKLITMQHFS